MNSQIHFSNVVVFVVAVVLTLSARASESDDLPEATLCFHGNVNPTGFAYVSYLQPRYPNVKFTAAVVGTQNDTFSLEKKADRLRADIRAEKCTVVFDYGGEDNYTLFRDVRSEPGMPLWFEKGTYQDVFKTIQDPDRYPAIRMWPQMKDQSITAVNTLLALGWKDIIVVSTAGLGQDVTLAAMSEQALAAGLRIHNTFVRGSPGLETDDEFVTAITSSTPTRAVLIATNDTSIVPPLVDAPRGLVAVVPSNFDDDVYVQSSLGVLSASEIEIPLPDDWRDHWTNTNKTALQQKWAKADPPSWTSYYFTNFAPLFYTDMEMDIVAMGIISKYYNDSTTNAAPTFSPGDDVIVDIDLDKNDDALRDDSTPVEMRARRAFGQSDSTLPPPPTAQQLLAIARGFEINTLSKPIRIANHSEMTLIPPRSLNVILTQPPKESVYYTWKVIANVTVSTGERWVTNEELQWPVVGKMFGIIDYLFPVPVPPPTTTDFTLTIIVTALGVAIGTAVTATVVYLVIRWASRRHCPKNTDEPFTAFFVSTHNEDEIRDMYGYSARDVFGGLRSIVVSAAAKHNCHVGRRLDAHFLVVSKSPENAVRCARDVVLAVSKLKPRQPPAPKVAVHHVGGTHTPSTRHTIMSGTHHDTAPGTGTGTIGSEKRTSSSGKAASDRHKKNLLERSGGLVPRISVGMAFAEGHIDLEDGSYTYGGEPVDIAASVADFAVHNQILATHELVQAIAAESAGEVLKPGAFYDGTATELAAAKASATSLANDFQEYCEREFGRRNFIENYELLEYVAAGFPRADPEAAEIAREGRHDSGASPGALSAALQAQCGGLVARNVATVAICIPAFRAKSTSISTIHRFEDAFGIVFDISTEFKGTFAAMHDGWCIVTVNGTGGVAQAPMRATSLAVAAVNALRHSGFGHDVTAGVVAGPTIAGSVDSRRFDAAAAKHMTAGGGVERARLLALGAALQQVSVFVSETVRRDSDFSFEFTSADVIAVRITMPGKIESGTVTPCRGSVSLRDRGPSFSPSMASDQGAAVPMHVPSGLFLTTGDGRNDSRSEVRSDHRSSGVRELSAVTSRKTSSNVFTRDGTRSSTTDTATADLARRNPSRVSQDDPVGRSYESHASPKRQDVGPPNPQNDDQCPTSPPGQCESQNFDLVAEQTCDGAVRLSSPLEHTMSPPPRDGGDVANMTAPPQADIHGLPPRPPTPAASANADAGAAGATAVGSAATTSTLPLLPTTSNTSTSNGVAVNGDDQLRRLTSPHQSPIKSPQKPTDDVGANTPKGPHVVDPSGSTSHDGRLVPNFTPLQPPSRHGAEPAQMMMHNSNNHDASITTSYALLASRTSHPSIVGVPGGPGASSSTCPAGPATYRPVLVYSVVAASKAGDVDDEWMYQLAAAEIEGGASSAIHSAFSLLMKGDDLPTAQRALTNVNRSLSGEAAAAAPGESPEGQVSATNGVRTALAGSRSPVPASGSRQASQSASPAPAVMPDRIVSDEHRVLRAAAGRGAEIAAALVDEEAGGGLEHRHLGRLTQVALQRSVQFASGVL